jgi:hypothetical protein
MQNSLLGYVSISEASYAQLQIEILEQQLANEKASNEEELSLLEQRLNDENASIREQNNVLKVCGFLFLHEIDDL